MKILDPSQRTFLDRLGRQLGFTAMEDWYKITQRDIISNGGSSFLQKHGNSPSRLLESAYPEHKWVVWKFNTVPVGYWSLENQIQFVDFLGKQLQFRDMED